VSEALGALMRIIDVEEGEGGGVSAGTQLCQWDGREVYVGGGTTLYEDSEKTTFSFQMTGLPAPLTHTHTKSQLNSSTYLGVILRVPSTAPPLSFIPWRILKYCCSTS
jgi:hypothetical protein